MNANAMPVAAPLAWYRQRWPWILLAGPAIVVIAGFVTAWLAMRSDDGLVAEDYYKRGLLINRQIEKSDRAAGITATVRIDTRGALAVELSGVAEAPAGLRMRFVHPTRAGRDHTVVLARTPAGTYVGAPGDVEPGRWLVSIESETWRLPTVEVTAPFAAVALGAAPRAR